MRLLARIKRAVAARWGTATRERGQARERLRALAGMADRDVLTCLDLPGSCRASEDATALAAHFRSSRMPSALFRPADRSETAKLVADRFPDSYKETLRRADLACRHVVDVLGSGETHLGDPINWWTDFKGRTWAWGDYEELNAKLYANDFRNDLYIGDVKLPWELNKHAHFLDLARAYWLTADERYAEALLTQMEDWIARNPFLWGLAWTQNLIVAQRAIAWVLALQAVRESPALTPARLLRILRSLYQHARYIPVHFEFAERASNHLFGNAAGLAALAIAFPEFREAAGWRRTALHVIEAELAKQVYPDGVQYEQSLNYHRYVVEFCLLPWLLSGAESAPYGEQSRRTLGRMLTVLLHMTQPTGLVQPVSDADGARVWRFNHRPINDHRALLNLGAALLADRTMKFGMEANSEDVLWWLGPEGYRMWEALPAEPPARSAAFPEGGYFVLREDWRPDALWAFFDCGHIGMGDWPDELSVGTHGHSDLLTFGLAAGGETLLTDIGSYTYTGSKPWHDYFRSARGHNVVLVDGQDQSVLTTSWALRERARPREARWRFTETADFVTGAHDGYRRLNPPVLHRRSLLLLRQERRLIIRDDLEGQGVHAMEALFHGTPAVTFRPDDRPDVWRLAGRRAGVTAWFLVGTPQGGNGTRIAYRVAKGETDPIDGWYADDYGTKEPAPVLHVSFQGTCPLRLYTVLRLDEPEKSETHGLWSTYEGAEAAWGAAMERLGPAPSPGTGKTIVMLVTNAGSNDPRVLRSSDSARRSGFAVSLVCRALPREQEKTDASSGPAVYRVARFPGMNVLKRLLVGRSAWGESKPGFWLKPRELWILGGMTWFNLQAVRKMWRRPGDLYHANDLDTLPAGVLLSRRHRVPLLYDSHELFAGQFAGASRQFQAILFALEHRLIRHAHKVVTVNRSIAETLAAWHRVPLPAVVMNCPFAGPTARPEAAGAEKPAPRKARVIYQGWYVRYRGLEELVLSAALYESAELYLRGYGDLEPALRALVRTQGLEERVHFLPPVSHAELVTGLAGFDVGVVPYRPTTLNNRLCLPNKVFEYLQAGLALAVSGLPELTRLVTETDAGELFDPESPGDIARAINALTRDPDRLERFKASALAAGRRFTWEEQGSPMLTACYLELAGADPGDRTGAR